MPAPLPSQRTRAVRRELRESRNYPGRDPGSAECKRAAAGRMGHSKATARSAFGRHCHRSLRPSMPQRQSALAGGGAIPSPASAQRFRIQPARGLTRRRTSRGQKERTSGQFGLAARGRQWARRTNAPLRKIRDGGAADAARKKAHQI
jgi:hypothetical protein